MKPEPLTSVDDADWLSLRLQLWPDCPRQQHLEEMASFLLDPVAYLEGLYVAPESRGKGVARTLVLAVSEWARAAGCTELASDTQPENLVSQAVHTQLGFVETERAVFFSKSLDPGKVD